MYGHRQHEGLVEAAGEVALQAIPPEQRSVELVPQRIRRADEDTFQVERRYSM
jgi:hypothetical protein